jgi:hypothetical protein
MIPLIDCSTRDAAAYYQGVVVIHNNTPCLFMSIGSDRVVQLFTITPDQKQVHLQAPYSELSLHVFPAFYTEQGDWVGLNVRRSTKRGMEYAPSLLPDLQKILLGEPANSGGRLAWNFFIKQSQGVRIIHHNGFPVGFIQGAEWCVCSSDVAERLEKVLESLGVEDVRVRLV